MAISLSEYAKQHPEAQQIDDSEREEAQRQAQDMEARKNRIAEAAEMKDRVYRQIERGDSPQMVLYTAIRCISLYSADDGYMTTCGGLLDEVYADLAQQSLLQDNAEIEAERLEEKQAQFRKTTRNSINRRMAQLQRLERELQGALNTLADMEKAEE